MAIFEDSMNSLLQYENVKIYDSNSLDLDSFKWEQGYIPHKLTRQEIIKPYLLSFIYYGDKELWYYILMLNKIVNIEEVVVGTEIAIPAKAELQEFVFNQKMKNT